MFHIIILRYILIIVLIPSIFIFSNCGKGYDEITYNNPFDTDNLDTLGNPYNLRIESTENGILVQWDKIKNIDGIYVYRVSNAGDSVKESGPFVPEKLEYLDKDIQPCVTYYYYIQAYRGGEKAHPSNNSDPITWPPTIQSQDGMPMVLIPAGEFQMGSNNGYNDEKPVHVVYVDSFYMDIYEVSNLQYRKFMDAKNYKAPYYWNDPEFNAPEQPVVGVTWDDAIAYCQWAGKRLPTEAEWEKAARGRLSGKQYVWGDDWPPPKGSGNFADETYKKWSGAKPIVEGYDDGYIYTAPAGSFKPNGYCLYDMAGNVREWCADWYNETYYSISPKQNPLGPNFGEFRVVRGSSWAPDDINNLRVAGRISNNPNYSGGYNQVGFRCGASRSD